MNAWVRPLRAANIRKRSNGLTNACRHPSPKIKNKSRHAAGSPGPPGASAPINVSTLASVESLRHAIERCAQTGGKESARWRQQYLVTTVAYRVAKITIPFRRCKKKKKKRERGRGKRDRRNIPFNFSLFAYIFLILSFQRNQLVIIPGRLRYKHTTLFDATF